MFKNLRSVFKDGIFLQLAVDLAGCLHNEYDLNSRLGSVTGALAKLSGLTGAMLVACDSDGSPLRYTAVNLSIGKAGGTFSALAEIKATIGVQGVWKSLPADLIEAPDASSVKAQGIYDEGTLLGMVFVGLTGANSSVLAGLGRALGHLRWVIGDALRLEESRLFEQVRKLESEELGRLDQIKPQVVAERLKNVFQADTVTILVLEQEKLYLSATTDSELERVKVTNDVQEKLIGHVLRNGNPLRIRNSLDLDPEEVHLESSDVYNGMPLFFPESASRRGMSR